MKNEPVAWMEYIQGEEWEVWFVEPTDLPDGHTYEPLYTHPVKEQYKFGVDWSKDGNAVTVLKICEDGVAEVVFMDYREVTHPVKELTDEEILEAQKLFSNMHKNATESWGSLDLNNQSNLECARAWFIEGFAHGQKLKELTDEKITAIAKEIFKDYKNFHHYQIDFARAVIKEVSGK